MTAQINFLNNFVVTNKCRQKISVKSLDLERKVEEWRFNLPLEQTCNFLGIELVKILNKDGLENFMLYIVEIDCPELMKILLHTGEMSLLYCSIELNKCYNQAKSDDMRNLIKEELIWKTKKNI